MLIKSADDKTKRLALLEDLQKSPLLDMREKEWLRDELRRCKTGIEGERAAAFYLAQPGNTSQPVCTSTVSEMAVVDAVQIVVIQIGSRLISKAGAFRTFCRQHGCWGGSRLCLIDVRDHL